MAPAAASTKRLCTLVSWSSCASDLGAAVPCCKYLDSEVLLHFLHHSPRHAEALPPRGAHRKPSWSRQRAFVTVGDLHICAAAAKALHLSHLRQPGRSPNQA